MSYEFFDTNYARTEWNRVNSFSLLSNAEIFNSIVCRVINEAIQLLRLRHKTHIKRYGRDNERRLTGRHETADVSLYGRDTFLNLYV
jgi:glutamine synthetase